jgi:putative ABC transport system permease protein
MFSRLRSFWQNFWKRAEQEHDLDDEIRFHVEARADDLVRGGFSRAEASRRARLEFGALDKAKEACRESRRINWLEDLAQDLRFALRMLRKSPGFAAVAVLTLALGIGANTAIFSVVDNILLSPLPFKNPDRVVAISWAVPARDLPNGTVTLDVAGSYQQGSLNLAGSGSPQRIPAAEVSESFFRVFALGPALGRTFSHGDEQPGHAPVVILSHELWTSRYHSDPDIVSKIIYLNGKGFTPIGVLPERFDFPAKAQLWLPLPPSIEQDIFGGNAFAQFEVGRLRERASLAAARSEMEIIQQREGASPNPGNAVRVETIRRALAGDTRQAALMLFGAVGFVLLIACADVANLLLSRGKGRIREVAVRRTLGATKSRLLRQFLTESIFLAILGAVVGLLCACWGILALREMIPARGAFFTPISLNGSLLVFTTILAVGTGILTGLVPAFESSKASLSEGLKESACSSQEGFSFGFGAHRGMRSLLGVSEIALALILVVGATLFLRSLDRLLVVPPGFRTDNVLVARLSLLGPKFQQPSHRTQFLRQVLSRTRAIPGVQSAAFANDAPLDTSGMLLAGMYIHAADSNKPAPLGRVAALDMTASSDYFRTMGIPLLGGRDFNDSDANPKAPVAIITESIAKTLWPDRNPVGLHFSLEGISGSNPPIEVIGVIGDVHRFGLDEDIMSEMYFSATQDPPDETSLVLATRSNPLDIVGAVRQIIQDVDPDEPVSSFATMDQLLSQSVAQPRLRSILLGIFGGLALLLACVGVYGVISYTVSQRTHEIGIRMALGANRRDIAAIVSGYGIRLAVAGLGVGLAGAYFLARLASSFLYGVRPTDPTAYILGSVILASIVALASYIPARRAMRVDPVVALRHE